MAFVPFGGVAMVELLLDYDTQQCETTFYVFEDTVWTATGLLLLAATFEDWWTTEVRVLVPNTVALRAIKATSLASETAPGIELAVSPPSVGTGTSPQLPNNVTIALKWVTALRGRSFRGRTYHIGLAEGQVALNAVDSAHLANLLTAYESINDYLEAVNPDWDLVVASRYSQGLPRVSGLATPITGVTSDGVIDSQRRRLPKRGR